MEYSVGDIVIAVDKTLADKISYYVFEIGEINTLVISPVIGSCRYWTDTRIINKQRNYFPESRFSFYPAKDYSKMYQEYLMQKLV